MPLGGKSAQPIAEPFEARCHEQRNQQQESDPKDQTERQEPSAEQVPQSLVTAPTRRRAPDSTERILQFGEHAGRTDQECEDCSRSGIAAPVL